MREYAPIHSEKRMVFSLTMAIKFFLPTYESCYKLPEISQRLAVQRIECISSLLPAFEKSAFVQYCYMVRQSRLCNTKVLEEVASTLFATSEELDYLQPIGIAQSSTYQRSIRGIHIVINSLKHDIEHIARNYNSCGTNHDEYTKKMGLYDFAQHDN